MLMLNNILLLYIDPGTGSMLFSIIIGAAATLYFLSRAVIMKIKLFFSAGKSGAVVTKADYKPYVIYNEGNQYWTLFKPICDEFEKRGVAVNYLTSSKTDPIFDQQYHFIKAEFIGEGNSAFARLNLLTAGVVLMTTPGLQVYQLKRSKNVKHYAHILHAASDATMYRLFGIDYFDSILLTGDYQKADIRQLEQQRGLPAKELETVGCTYLDMQFNRICDIPEENPHNFTVLLSPSWGPSALLSRFGEKLLDPLTETGWHIIIRPHPQSKKSEPEMLKRLEDRYKTNSNVEWDYNRENIYSMKRADIMISDFSGIIFDYTFLCDKPVMYVKAQFDLRPYDAYDLDHQLWQFDTLNKIGVELKEESFANIKEEIQKLSDNQTFAQARQQAKKEAWMYQGEAASRIVNFLIRKEQQK